MKDRPSFLAMQMLESQNSRLVGMKTARLSRLLRYGFPVPDGFSLTTHLHKQVLTESLTPDSASDIRSMAEQLLATSKSGYLILRISPAHDARTEHGIPEQIRYISEIGNIEDLLDAIHASMHSIDTTRSHKPWMGILVQEQLRPLFSCMASTHSSLRECHGRRGTLITITQGTEQGSQLGVTAGNMYFVRGMEEGYAVDVLDQQVPDESGFLYPYLQKIAHYSHGVATLLSEAQRIEWIVDGSVHIVQTHTLPTRRRRPSHPRFQEVCAIGSEAKHTP